MTNVSQVFNVDLRVYYGSQVRFVKGTYVPDSPIKTVVSPVIYESAYRPALTDWGRRLISLPNIRKSVENWTGKFETSEVTLELADTDGSASTRLGAAPFGNYVELWSKVAENPEYWQPVISGNITGVSRARGLTNVTFYDAFKNLYNSQFVPDYFGIATHIENKLYGTVKDVIGSNVYIDDRGDVRVIRRKIQNETSSNWLGAVAGAVIGGAAALLTGGVGWGIAVAAGGGFLSGVPPAGQDAKYEYFYRVSDFNAIPDGYIFGGQSLKFSAATVDGRASGVNGSLFTVPKQLVRGGQFENGIYGTIELDDLLHDVKKGDYVYSELPLIYWGSPDDIIRNMLCGSNVSVRYEYPKDFCDDWFEQTAPLRHIEAYAYVENFERGGVIEAIDSLCKEFGFTFYLDERNKFAVRMLRQYDVYGSNVIGTINETYNVLNDGIEITHDINTSYTDIVYRYKDTYVGNLYEQQVNIVTGAATWAGGQHRVLDISSKWIHDKITGQYIAKRIARRYATVNPTIRFETSLYAVPISLGEILDVTGWAPGTHVKYEVTNYEKDFHRSIAVIEAESADFLYKNRGYFAWGSSSSSGLGQLNLSTTAPPGGALLQADMNDFYNRARITTTGSIEPNLNGSYIVFSGEPWPRNQEIMKVLEQRRSGLYTWDLLLQRGAFNTPIFKHSKDSSIWLMATYSATCYNMNPAYGTIFRWY